MTQIDRFIFIPNKKRFLSWELPFSLVVALALGYLKGGSLYISIVGGLLFYTVYLLVQNLVLLVKIEFKQNFLLIEPSYRKFLGLDALKFEYDKFNLELSPPRVYLRKNDGSVNYAFFIVDYENVSELENKLKLEFKK